MNTFICDRNRRHTVTSTNFPTLILERDNWNDYSYFTTFRATLLISQETTAHLGEVRIMTLGQLAGVEHYPFQDLDSAQQIPPGRLQKICSLSSSQKYYDELALLNIELAHDLLRTLRDASYLPEVRQEFQSEKCFQISLLRDSSARQLLDLSGERFGARQELSNKFSVSIRLTGSSGPHKFDFDFTQLGKVPRRINSIVGLNGVGKTQVMARLAMLLSRFSRESEAHNRSTLQSDDILDPVPSIYNVVAVSFSAFDEFERPTQAEGEKFKYSYCGLQTDGGALRTKDDLLKDIRTMISAAMSPEKRTLLKNVLQSLVKVENIDTFVDQPDLHENLYQRLSAGQRLALSCICHILAKIGPRTLVLFDEPELHLHPQLLNGLLSALSEILNSQDSFAIIATHSPLVIQQLPKECVYVIRRDRMMPIVLRPTFQTFGESISDITRFVFASTESDRDYRSVLDQMFEEAQGNIDEIRAQFDGQLSLNADIYLESLRAGSERVQ